MYSYRRKNVIMIVMIVSILLMAVGYALISSNLNIDATGGLTGSWGVRITNVTYQVTGKAYNISEPTFTDTTVRFNVGVKVPGDKMTFSVTVQNFGNLDALLNDISAMEKGTESIIYSIDGINNQELLKAGESKVFTVSTYFDINATELPTDNIKDLIVKLNYIQYNDQSLNTTPPVIENALTTLSGNNRLVLNNAEASNLVNYKIKGNSVQNGTPSPESPVEIQSVGIKTSNLAEKLFNINSSGANVSSTILIQETKKLVNASLVKVNGGQKYTLSRTNQGADFRYFWFDTKPILTETKSIGGGYLAQTQLTLTVTAPENAEYLFVRWSEGYDAGNIQIRENDTSTDYEPYGYKIPITVGGKNLLNINTTPVRNTLTVVEHYNNGLKIVSSATKATESLNLYYDLGNYSDYVGKTISFTLKNVSNTDNKSISYYIVKSSGDWAKNTIIKSRSTSLGATGTITATIEADDAATNLGIRIYLGTDGVGDEFILDNIQVEEGSVATNYEPYVEPKQYNIYLGEPLRRIGDYADYIDFENQKVVRQIQKNIITGTEANWEIMDYNTIPIYRYRLSVENIVKGTNYTEQLCNYLQGEDITTKDTKIGMSVYYSSSLGGTFFRMRTGTQYENTSALKEYLSNLYTSGKPIEYYFATTEILEETMELPNIYIPKGNFVLSVDSNGIDVPIEASYYKQF